MLPAAQPAQALVRYAREHNLVRVLMGRNTRRWPWHATLAEQIGQSASDLDLLQVGTLPGRDAATNRKAPRTGTAAPRAAFWPGYIAAALACCIAAVIATPLANVLELTNIVMLFLLVVVGGWRCALGAARPSWRRFWAWGSLTSSLCRPASTLR